MSVFSTNQVRQVYVSKELKSPNVIATDAAGAIAVKVDNAKTHMYFEYMGAGGMTRSDLIDLKNLIRIKATDADSMAKYFTRYKVTLDPSVNGGAPISGQDYILNITIRGYVGISPEDQYFKFGMVHAVSGMTASDFYKTLVISLVKNFSREESNLFKFYLETGGTAADTVAGTPTEVTKYTDFGTLTGTYTGVIIEEAPQKWVLGVIPQTEVDFNILPQAVTDNGDERIWGIAKKVTPANSIANGQKIADLEYFCMGERGDQYRMVGFPHVIRTTYLVDPTVKYNVIDIHYAYVGSNEGVQKSEKTITLVIPKVGATNSVSNVLANSIIDAINTATGLTIAKLDTSAGD